MLVLARKKGEALIFKTVSGLKIVVRVEDCNGTRARLSCEAPASVIILREELEGKTGPVKEENE